METNRLVSACAMIAMWIKFSYWMRLFHATSHFIRMIMHVLRDVRPFMIMFFIVVGLFANSFLILDEIRRDKGMTDFIIQPAVGNHVIDALIRTYLMGIGEFGLENFHKENAPLVWILFIASTFITQLVFLNVLIAIMSDTFAREQENVEQARFTETIQLVNDHVWVIDLDKEFSSARHVYIIEAAGRSSASQKPM